MNNRDRLIELLSTKIYPKEGVDYAEVVADYLLDNNVVALPCKVGDTVYTNMSMRGWLKRKKDRLYAGEIISMGFSRRVAFVCAELENGCRIPFNFSEFGKNVFLTREEAKKTLEEKGV